MMDVAAQDMRRSRSPDAFQDRLAALVRAIALDVAMTQRRVVRDQNATFRAVAKKGGGLVLGHAGVPYSIVAHRNLAAQAEECRIADLDAHPVQKVCIRPISRQPPQFVRIVVVAVHEYEGAVQIAQHGQRVARTFAARREVSRADNDIHIPRRIHDRTCDGNIPMQVGEGEKA